MYGSAKDIYVLYFKGGLKGVRWMGIKKALISILGLVGTARHIFSNGEVELSLGMARHGVGALIIHRIYNP